MSKFCKFLEAAQLILHMTYNLTLWPDLTVLAKIQVMFIAKHGDLVVWKGWSFKETTKITNSEVAVNESIEVQDVSRYYVQLCH